MTITPEGRVKAKVKALLNKYNVYHFMPATGGYGRSGIPDIICCAQGPKGSHGYFLAIECKANGGKLTALQHRELENIKENGGIALVIDETKLGDLETLLIDLTSSEE
jgi:hypothetical protein